MRKAGVHGAFTHETADAFTTVLSDTVQHPIEFSSDRRGLPRQPMTAFGRKQPFKTARFSGGRGPSRRRYLALTLHN